MNKTFTRSLLYSFDHVSGIALVTWEFKNKMLFPEYSAASLVGTNTGKWVMALFSHRVFEAGMDYHGPKGRKLPCVVCEKGMSKNKRQALQGRSTLVLQAATQLKRNSRPWQVTRRNFHPDRACVSFKVPKHLPAISSREPPNCEPGIYLVGIFPLNNAAKQTPKKIPFWMKEADCIIWQVTGAGMCVWSAHVCEEF